MNQLKNIERLFNVINRSVFMTTGTLDYDRVTDATIRLANEVHEYFNGLPAAFSVAGIETICRAPGPSSFAGESQTA